MCEKFKDLKVIEEASALDETFAILLYNELCKDGKIKESGVLRSSVIMEIVSNHQEQKSPDWKIAHSKLAHIERLINVVLESDVSNLTLGLPRIASAELNGVPGITELRERLLQESDLFLSTIAEASEGNSWKISQRTAEILSEKIGEVSSKEETIIRLLAPKHLSLVFNKVNKLSDSGFIEFLIWGGQFVNLMPPERQLELLKGRKKIALSLDSLERIKMSAVQEEMFSTILKFNPPVDTVANMLLSSAVKIEDVDDSFYLGLGSRADLVSSLSCILREDNKLTGLLLGMVDEWDGRFDFGILSEKDYAQISHDATEKQIEKMLVISSKTSNEKMFNHALRMIKLNDALRVVREHGIKISKFTPTEENASKYFSISAALQEISGTYDFKTGVLNVNDMGLFKKLGVTVKMSPVFEALRNMDDGLGKVDVVAVVRNEHAIVQMANQKRPSEISSLVKEKKGP